MRPIRCGSVFVLVCLLNQQHTMTSVNQQPMGGESEGT